MRVLIVGQGSIGKRHLGVARDLLPDADIRVLRHQPAEIAPDLANGCFANIADAVAFAPNISVIAWPATHHIEIAQQLAAIGTHLLIEKPLSVDRYGVDALIQTCRAQQQVCMVGYNLRYMDSLERFRQEVQSGRVGRILSVRSEIGQYLPDWRPGTDYSQGVSARQDLGGGALLELSHEIDYLRWIFGEVDWVHAAMCRHSDLKISVEDTVYLTLGFVSQSSGSQLVASLNLDFIRRDPVRTCHAIGADGTLRWTAWEGLVELYDPDQAAWVTLYKQGTVRDSYHVEWRDFLHCVESGEQPLVTLEDGNKALDIIVAARQSSEGGCRVSINNFDNKVAQ